MKFFKVTCTSPGQSAQMNKFIFAKDEQRAISQVIKVLPKIYCGKLEVFKICDKIEIIYTIKE